FKLAEEPEQRRFVARSCCTTSGETPALRARPLGSLLDDLPQGILHAANGILDLAGGTLGLAVSLQLGIADDLADGFLDRAFDASRGSRDSILIHDHLLPLSMTTYSCFIGPRDAGRPSRRDSRLRHTGMPVHGARGYQPR